MPMGKAGPLNLLLLVICIRKIHNFKSGLNLVIRSFCEFMFWGLSV